MQPNLSRIQPQMGAAAYKTYEVRSPLATHFRKATCAEVECPHYLNGWRVNWDNLTPDLRHAVTTSGRKYRLEVVSATESWLVFEAGQDCFRASQHRTRVDRPPLYLVRDGDWRGNPRGTKARLHQRPDNWVEDFAEHQQKLSDEIAKG